MIPKIIHYCWFGHNPKPKLANKCIKSWKKYCKNYKIIEWNEESFDISASPLYVKQAYEAKKWAFVTDYVRLWAMIKYGGIYMDTDVEVIKSLDKFLENKAFSGFESQTQIPTGIMACEKEFPLFKELLQEYETAFFIKEDGTFDTTTNVTRITNLCIKYGLKPNGEMQIINGFTVFPKDFFCPLSWDTRKLEKTKNTHTIHWFSASWWDSERRSIHRKNLRQYRIEKIVSIFDPRKYARTVLGENRYNKLKKLLKK